MKKIFLITILVVIILVSLIPMKVNAEIEIDSAYIYANKETDYLLKWNGVNVYTHMAVYQKDGVEYPAYCMNRDLQGVKIGFSQTVDIRELVNNVMVWRAITNGYPYKTISELGCQTEEEAYLATKQAVYCMLVDRDVNEYTAIGESGERTLNALKQIVNAARNSNVVKVSAELKINQKESLWEVDEIDKKYVSQIFSVSAEAGFNTYIVSLDNLNIEGLKITDLNNNPKTEFNSNEEFKILIPIANIEQDGDFVINVSGKVRTKPVLYGESRDASLQSYALTGYSYEDGTGSKKIYYTKNETKIIIVKQDETGEKRLQGVEFELLDEEKNALYTGLITNENGEIELANLIPGTYYIKETKTLAGYDIYNQIIEVKLDLNETATINVINQEEKPSIELDKKETELTVKNTKKDISIRLPKTGM